MSENKLFVIVIVIVYLVLNTTSKKVLRNRASYCGKNVISILGASW